jgi:hypothetical protein
MKTSLIDIPVLLIFMARPEQFALVFDQVKIARPSKLFLYQDGPREGNANDKENIAKCRLIAENIDWDCEVHKFYQEENVGCDPSEYIAQKWMFSSVDRGIILEDDDVPSQSFFPFCKDLLERYYNDTRINYICGMNHLGQYNCETSDSYFFTSSGSIWGWATWKRNVDLWEEHLDFLDDGHSLKLLQKVIGTRYFKFKMPTWKRHRASGRAYYESILGSSILLNSQLNIVPAKNLISNVGIGLDTTHSVDSLKKLPKEIRKLFFMKTYELEFPLKHPKYIINDLFYQDEVNRILGNTDSPLLKMYNKIKNRVNKIIAKVFSL